MSFVIEDIVCYLLYDYNVMLNLPDTQFQMSKQILLIPFSSYQSLYVNVALWEEVAIALLPQIIIYILLVGSTLLLVEALMLMLQIYHLSLMDKEAIPVFSKR